MATGISLDSECFRAWEEMKLKHKYSYILFKVQDDRVIVVDKTGAQKTSYAEFQKVLPQNDCRYAVVEVPGTTKIVFVMWNPHGAHVKQRMIYASTRTTIVDKLEGIAKTVQADDVSELDLDKLKKLFNV